MSWSSGQIDTFQSTIFQGHLPVVQEGRMPYRKIASFSSSSLSLLQGNPPALKLCGCTGCQYHPLYPQKWVLSGGVTHNNGYHTQATADEKWPRMKLFTHPPSNQPTDMSAWHAHETRTLHSPHKPSSNWQVSVKCTWDKIKGMQKKVAGPNLRSQRGEKWNYTLLATAPTQERWRNTTFNLTSLTGKERKEERKKERKKYHHSPSPGSTRKPHTHTLSLSIYGSFLGRFLWFHAPVSAHGVAGMVNPVNDFHQESGLGGGFTSLEDCRHGWSLYSLPGSSYFLDRESATTLAMPGKCCTTSGLKVAEFSGNYRQLFGLRLRRGEEHQWRHVVSSQAKVHPRRFQSASQSLIAMRPARLAQSCWASLVPDFASRIRSSPPEIVIAKCSLTQPSMVKKAPIPNGEAS